MVSAYNGRKAEKGVYVTTCDHLRLSGAWSGVKCPPRRGAKPFGVGLMASYGNFFVIIAPEYLPASDAGLQSTEGLTDRVINML